MACGSVRQRVAAACEAWRVSEGAQTAAASRVVWTQGWVWTAEGMDRRRANKLVNNSFQRRSRVQRCATQLQLLQRRVRRGVRRQVCGQRKRCGLATRKS
jgi:hypothetical protein